MIGHAGNNEGLHIVILLYLYALLRSQVILQLIKTNSFHIRVINMDVKKYFFTDRLYPFTSKVIDLLFCLSG